jgi:hypothetical protein
MRSFAGNLLVERDFTPQYAVDDVGCDAARGEAWDFGLRQGSWTGHSNPSLPRIVSGARSSSRAIQKIRRRGMTLANPPAPASAARPVLSKYGDGVDADASSAETPDLGEAMVAWPG